MSSVSKFIPGNEINNTLYKAIYSGDLEKVNDIVDTYGLTHCPSWAEGHDLLFTSIECKHLDLAKLLIQKGCKLEAAQSATSRCVLHLAVRKGDLELISMLLDKVTDSLLETEQGDSLLHVAITEAREEVVKLLLDHGADTESRSIGGMTPLHYAAVRGHVGIIELLLSSGANTESQDINGKTGLFLAVSSGHQSAVKVLLKNGANCRCKKKNGLTPLLDATIKCYLEIVKDLLAYGADINDTNSFGQTPLHIACMQNNKNLISILLNAGADINATDSMGMVPCDVVVKKVSPGSVIFVNSCIPYILGKHLSILKVGGLYLNKKNQMFYDMFYNMYCKDITVGDVLLSPTSDVLLTTVKNCEEEICRMKIIKSRSGFTVYDIFVKLKSSLSVTTSNEMLFLQSIHLREEFPLYGSIVTSLLKIAELRNKLLKAGEEWFSFLNQIRQVKVTPLPEEVVLHILSFLTNAELKQLIHCGEEINKQQNTETANKFSFKILV